MKIQVPLDYLLVHWWQCYFIVHILFGLIEHYKLIYVYGKWNSLTYEQKQNKVKKYGNPIWYANNDASHSRQIWSMIFNITCGLPALIFQFIMLIVWVTLNIISFIFTFKLIQDDNAEDDNAEYVWTINRLLFYTKNGVPKPRAVN